MSLGLTSDSIALRQRKSPAGQNLPPEESVVTLSRKLDELFDAGYERDDIFGLVIPLLMQGKVRVDHENRSERLEIADPNLRLQRSVALKVYADYLASKGEALSAR